MHCLISEFEVLGIKGSFLHSELISNLSRALCKKARCLHQPQAAHLLLFEKETASHNSGSEWDALSLTSLSRKLHPTLSAHSGTQLPNGPRFLETDIPVPQPSKRDAASRAKYRLLTVVVFGFFARIELQHAAAVFAHSELGAL